MNENEAQEYVMQLYTIPRDKWRRDLLCQCIITYTDKPSSRIIITIPDKLIKEKEIASFSTWGNWARKIGLHMVRYGWHHKTGKHVHMEAITWSHLK